MSTQPRGRASAVQLAESLKEGIYVTFTLLAVLLSLTGHGDTHAAEAIVTLLVTAIGVSAAILVADAVSHVAVHDQLMSRAERHHSWRASLAGLSTVAAPVLVLLLAVAGAIADQTAIWIAIGVLATTLIIIAAIALRGTSLSWPNRLLLLLCGGLLGAGVIVIQILAHG